MNDAFLKAKQAEMDAAYRQLAAQLTCFTFDPPEGWAPPPPPTRWQLLRWRIGDFRRRLNNAWLCIRHGYEVSDE